MKKLIIPEDVHAHGVKLEKGEYTEAQLEEKGYENRQVAQLVARTAAYWGHADGWETVRKGKQVVKANAGPEPAGD